MTHEHELPGAGQPEPAESAELRALYRGLQPPSLADEAADADPETARVVAWMRGAWGELALPQALVPHSVLRPLARRRRARTPVLTAAAVVLTLAGAALWRELGSAGRDAAPLRVVQVPEPVTEPVLPAPSTAPSTVHVLAARPDQFELRSGPVRLVLLTPPTQASRISPGS